MKKQETLHLADIRAYQHFFKAIGNAHRLAIVELLRHGAKTVTEIQEALGIEQSHLSHNLRCLLDCRFVSVEREGKTRVYRLEDTVVPLLDKVDVHLKKYSSYLKTCGCC